jgi:hypothetical protein
MTDIDKLFSDVQSRGQPTKHPYAHMAVGDIVEVAIDTGKMQRYAHSYAGAVGKKFATRKVNGVLYVKRIA